ncbi:MAG: hypothetical protein HYY25_12240 [Candidatus Wallbacteria bacterium]|nr:hypothetical protein [Candidatus Wallbacteria bacterium]
MDPWAIGSNGVMMVLAVCLGLLVTFQPRPHRAAALFLGLCLAAACFGATRILLEVRTGIDEKLFWSRVGYLCAFSLLPILLEFPDAFLGTKSTSRMARAVVWASCAAFVALDFTPWMLTVGDDRVVGSGGPALLAVWVVFTAVNLRFLILFWRARRAATDEMQQNRIDYLMAGVLAFGLCAGIDIAHRLGVYKLFPGLIAQWGVLAFLGMSAYAIIRHQLLDIEVAVSRGLVYTLSTASVGVFFVLFSELMATLGERRLALIHPANAGFFAGILAALTFDPIRFLVQRVVDYVFFGDKESLERVTRFRKLHTMVLERNREGLLELQLHLTSILAECEREAAEGGARPSPPQHGGPRTVAKRDDGREAD